jgi:hypothetical protein
MWALCVLTATFFVDGRVRGHQRGRPLVCVWRTESKPNNPGRQGETVATDGSEDEPPELEQSTPLEGTSAEAVSFAVLLRMSPLPSLTRFVHKSSTLAHEIFLSQARMVEAIDSLSRKVEYLSRALRAPVPITGGPAVDSSPQYAPSLSLPPRFFFPFLSS